MFDPKIYTIHIYRTNVLQ